MRKERRKEFLITARTHANIHAEFYIPPHTAARIKILTYLREEEEGGRTWIRYASRVANTRKNMKRNTCVNVDRFNGFVSKRTL